MEETTGVNVWNPDKQLSEQITLKNLVDHNMAMNLARKGIPENPTEKPLSFNDRISLRFKGLNEVISSQQTIIVNAKPIVKTNCLVLWRRKYKGEEQQKENLFEKEDNDYNEIVAILEFLDDCEQQVIKARKTKSLHDDFIWEKDNNQGEKTFELTKNFFLMMKSLEESYEETYEILINNRIVSSGMNTDEELDEKKKEEEAINRIVIS